MKKAIFTSLILSVLTSSAWADNINCRGMDAQGHQVAIQVNNIHYSDNGLEGRLRFVSLKLFNGRQDICKRAQITGDNELRVECNSHNDLHQASTPGLFVLNLSRTGAYDLKGQLCVGAGQDGEVSGVSLSSQDCLKLLCRG